MLKSDVCGFILETELFLLFTFISFVKLLVFEFMYVWNSIHTKIKLMSIVMRGINYSISQSIRQNLLSFYRIIDVEYVIDVNFIMSTISFHLLNLFFAVKHSLDITKLSLTHKGIN